MEILVPVRNSRRLLKEVISGGADAVYFGVKPYPGRESRYSLLWTQIEFDLKSAIEAIEYIGSSGRRSYITLNVPYSQNQLESVFELSCTLIEAGASALIVSDPGLMGKIIKEKPSAELHVSILGRTANSQTALFYKNLGAKRIILERVLSVGEIGSIRERAGIDVEVFIYGNFCYFYHGGCRISSYFYGEQCIGPCMDAFRISGLPEAGSHPFRSKPLNGYYFLNGLFRAGVSAVKIEGRQKSDRYILDSLVVLRKAVDALKEGKNTPEPVGGRSLFVLPPESTAGFYQGAPALCETMMQKKNLYNQIAYLRTYFTFEGLPLALKMRRLKKEARAIGNRCTDE